MLIHEVCERCSLTKKAVEYYIKQGLVDPKVDANGYRNFSEQDLSCLKEISVLRGLGLGISEIRNLLASNNKSAVLSKYSYGVYLKRQLLVEQQERLEQLAEDYDIDRELNFIHSHLQRKYSILERISQAFPGVLGVYLSIHFGPFLHGEIDSAEKEQAYIRIVDFLDHLSMTEETERFLEQNLTLMQSEDMAAISGTMQQVILNDPEGYMQEQQEQIEAYLESRNSESYKTSPAYKLQLILSEFQRESGYIDIFIPNLKILSPAYREYADKLQAANQLFMKKFPTNESTPGQEAARRFLYTEEERG